LIIVVSLWESRNWWERIDETAAPAADDAAQEYARRSFEPVLAVEGGRCDDPRLSLRSHSGMVQEK
jgi:hypothetical protein